MTPIRLSVVGALLFVAATFVGCDCCDPPVQAATSCWSHEGTSGSECAESRDHEPNDLLPTAVATTISCQQRTLQGTLGPGDVDVYQATGDVCFKPGSRPTAAWQASHGRLCLFAGCNHGLMTFNGCEGGSGMHYREGILGCCIEGPGRVTLDSRCSVAETHLQAWIVVDQGDDGACEDYDVSFHD